MAKKFFLFFLLTSCVFARRNTSPYQTVYNHLYYLQPDSYHPDSAAKSLYPQKKLSPEERIQRAIQLKNIFDALGFYVNTDEIPNNPNYKDTTTGRHIYYLNKELLPDIYLKKYGKNWYYSRFTVEQIPNIYKKIYPFGIHRVVDYFSLHRNFYKFLGLYSWQWAGILLLAGLGTLIFFVFRFLVRRLVRFVLRIYRKYASRKDFPVKNIILVANAVSYLIVTFYVKIFLRALLLPIEINRFIIGGIKILSAFLIVLIVYRIADLLLALIEKAASKTRSKLDDQLIPLLRTITHISIWVIGGLFILQNFGYNISALLAGISIGGIALALAAQDTLKNFFGSVMIFLDKPFLIGDWIQGGGVDGVVENVGLRATRIRTFEDSLVYVPNAILLDNPIDNKGLRRLRRYKTFIGLEYSTTKNQITRFMEELKKFIEEHPALPSERSAVVFHSFGDSALQILFVVFIDAKDWNEEMKVRQEINLYIMELAEKLNIGFAFPSQSLYIEKFPHPKNNE